MATLIAPMRDGYDYCQRAGKQLIYPIGCKDYDQAGNGRQAHLESGAFPYFRNGNAIADNDAGNEYPIIYVDLINGHQSKDQPHYCQDGKDSQGRDQNGRGEGTVDPARDKDNQGEKKIVQHQYADEPEQAKANTEQLRDEENLQAADDDELLQ